MTRWPQTDAATVWAPDPAVLAQWRADETPFYAVVLVIRSSAVAARRADLVRRLHPYGESTIGASHVTLAAVGSAKPDLSGLQGRRLDLLIGGGDTFVSAAFLQVTGPGLVSLREEVLQRVDGSLEAREWIPHVTVATYRWPVPLSLIKQRLTPARAWSPIAATGVLELVVVGKQRGTPLTVVQ